MTTTGKKTLTPIETWKARLAEARRQLRKINAKDRAYWKAHHDVSMDIINEQKRLKDRIYYLKVMTAKKQYMNRYFYSDVKPYEIVRWINDEKCVIREMKVTKKKNSEPYTQEWNIRSDRSNPEMTVRLHKDGAWYLPQDRGTRFHLSLYPHNYYDYSF